LLFKKDLPAITPANGYEQFILANQGLPERQKGNSLGQRPRKTHFDSFQPEGLAQLSHTFSVLANERERFFLGRCPRLFPFSPSGCFAASRWQVKLFMAISRVQTAASGAKAPC